MDLTKLRVYRPPDLEDHAVVTIGGTVYQVAMVEPEYTVGSLETSVVGFGPGTWLPASAFSDPEPASKGFTLVVEDRTGRGVKRRLEGIKDALRYAAEVWRPDGQMLPVTRAGAESMSYNTLEATFYPTGPGWQHPLLDRMTDVPYALESSPTAPIVNAVNESALRAAFTPARMPQGTLTVGVFCDEPALYSVASVGATISPQGQANPGSAGVFYSLGSFYLHAFGRQTAILATEKRLRLFALTWRENGQVQPYSFSEGVLTAHAPLALGSVPAFSERELSLGYISGVGGIEGAFMPGAPRLGDTGVPFVSSRVMTYPEVSDGLAAWYQYLTSFSSFTPAPVVSAIEVLKPATAQLVLNTPKKVQVTVLRKGGAPAVSLNTVSDSISLRVSSIVEIVDSDLTSDILELTLLAEEGLSLGDHSITLTATTDTGLRSTSVLDIRVMATAAGLPANTTHFWAVYDPTNKSLATLRKNTGSAQPSGDLVLGGLTRPSTGWDAIIGDGSDITPYGPSIVTVDNAVTLTADHTVSFAFWDVNKLAVNSVLFSVASQTNKWDFYQVYRDTGGLRLRVSKGTSAQTVSTSGASLSVNAGVMTLAVRSDADANVTLVNPTLDQSASLPNPGLSGSGRVSVFGTKLSDGTVQSLSVGVMLAGSVQTGLTAD